MTKDKFDIVFRSVFLLKEDFELSFDLAPGDIEQWDSIGHVNMITAFEEEFGIQFSDEDLMEVVNLKTLYETTTRLIQNQ